MNQKELKTIIHYDPETGVIKKIKCRRTDWIGREAGSINKKGYRAISVNNKVYLAHRLAWLYVTGEWPKEIDHIDGDKLNNRFSNLRLATTSQNVHGQKRRKNNTSGFKGVTYNKNSKKWLAQIKVNRQPIYLGIYDTPETAHAAYCAAASNHFGQFARFA